MDNPENIADRAKEEIRIHYGTRRALIAAYNQLTGENLSESNLSDYLNPGTYRKRNPGKEPPVFGNIWQKRLQQLGLDSAYIMTGRRAAGTVADGLIRGKRLVDITVPTDATLFEAITEIVEGGVRVQVFEAIREIKKIQPMLEDEGVIILRTPRGAAEGKVPYSGKAAATPLSNDTYEGEP